MNIPMELLQRILDKQLPLPGSINFDNAAEYIDVPLYQNVGFLSMGKDPGGVTGTSEPIRECVGVLQFRKNKAQLRWELVHLNNEQAREIAHLWELINQAKAQIQELIKQVQKEFPRVEEKKRPKKK